MQISTLAEIDVMDIEAVWVGPKYNPWLVIVMYKSKGIIDKISNVEHC